MSLMSGLLFIYILYDQITNKSILSQKINTTNSTFLTFFNNKLVPQQSNSITTPLKRVENKT